MLDKLKVLILLLIPIIVGLYIRFDDLNFWSSHREAFFYKDRPLFTSYDAFFFARWAKEYREGNFKSGEVDPLRFVPDNYIKGKPTYPDPIPMESWLGAKLSSIFNKEVENIALWSTPLLSVFFVVPLFFFFYRLSLPISGFFGSLVGVTSLIYVIRTSVARFDTDSLNLFFPFAIAYCFLEYFRSKGKVRYVWIICAGFLGQLYNWWYSHPGLILVILLTFFIVLVIEEGTHFGKRTLKEVGVLIVAVNPLVIYEGIYNFFGLVKAYLIGFFKPEISGGFPNVFMSISEAKHFDVKQVAVLACGDTLLFFVGIFGFILLTVYKWRRILLVLPIFLIGLMALKGGNRFSMYLAPFVGIGIGYLIDVAVSYIAKSYNMKQKFLPLFHIGIAVFLLGVNYFSAKQSYALVARPKITPALEADFIKLSSITPKGSWIWTWWDYGTAIQYLGNRAVFHDGQSQTTPKTYFVATTFSASDPEQAYNTIVGIASVGVTKIYELEKSGEKGEKLRDRVFKGEFLKPLTHPVYWAFTEDEVGKFGWINYFGTWNFELKKGLSSPIYQLRGCNMIVQKGKRILKCNGISIDITTGKVYQGRKSVPLKKLVVKEKGAIKMKDFNPLGLYVEIINEKQRGYVFLMAQQPFRSMFNQMYILRNYDKRFFELVYDDFPTMVLYRIRDLKEVRP